MPGYEGVEKIRKGMFAFLMEETQVYKIMEDTFQEHEKCGLVSVRYLKFIDPYLAIQKNSPFKEILSVKWVYEMWFNLDYFFSVPFSSLQNYQVNGKWGSEATLQ